MELPWFWVAMPALIVGAAWSVARPRREGTYIGPPVGAALLMKIGIVFLVPAIAFANNNTARDAWLYTAVGWIVLQALMHANLTRRIARLERTARGPHGSYPPPTE